jgi:hypothetical protein
MEAIEILQKVNELPAETRMFIAERIIHSCRKTEEKESWRQAAELAYMDYKNDKELTISTELDGEDFYEYKTK